LDEKIVEERQRAGVDVIGDNRALTETALEGRPDGRDRKRQEHEDADDGHEEVLHEPVVEERLVVLRPEIWFMLEMRFENRKLAATNDPRARTVPGS